MIHHSAEACDEFDPVEEVKFSPRDVREARISFIEQALKRDPCKEYRRELVREYLDLTEPEPKEIDL